MGPKSILCTALSIKFFSAAFEALGSGCSTVVENKPWEHKIEEIVGSVPPGAALFPPFSFLYHFIINQKFLKSGPPNQTSEVEKVLLALIRRAEQA